VAAAIQFSKEEYRSTCLLTNSRFWKSTPQNFQRI